MNQNNPSSKSTFLAIAISFIAGAIFGLVVLGWVIWPVSWEDAPPAVLSIEAKQDILRAAIDSFSLNLDRDLAQARFHALEDGAENSLAAIYATAETNSKQAVERFADAVGAAGVLSELQQPVTPELTPSSSMSWFSNRPLWMNLIGIAGVLLLAFLVFSIITSQKKKKVQRLHRPYDSVRTIAPDQEIRDPNDLMLNDEFRETPEELIKDAGSPLDSQEDGSEFELKEAELPTWLKEASNEELPLSGEYQDTKSSAELNEEDIAEISASNVAFVPKTNAIGEETAEQTYAKFSGDLSWMPGLDEPFAEKLREIGVTAPLLLLKIGANQAGREQISKQTGIDTATIFKWVNYVDLLRIKGLVQEDAKVLIAADQDRVSFLADNNPVSLFEIIQQRVELMNISYNQPTLEQLENWIKQAKSLPKIVTE